MWGPWSCTAAERHNNQVPNLTNPSKLGRWGTVVCQDVCEGSQSYRWRCFCFVFTLVACLCLTGPAKRRTSCRQLQSRLGGDQEVISWFSWVEEAEDELRTSSALCSWSG